MEKRTPREIQALLAQPFAPEDLEWRLQVAFSESMKGIAVPYVTNRAIMNRLDSVVGVENWRNEFKPWHGNGKKDAQICGISVYFEDRGWVTKWDGSEDSDIEPIKGGLSDSMKRAAVHFGIGRVLYSLDESVIVDIEKKGKSFIIKDSERQKLDQVYLSLLKRMNLIPAPAGGIASQLVSKQVADKQAPDSGKKITNLPWQAEYIVSDVKEQKGMNGNVSTSLMLNDPSGKKALAFYRGRDARLRNGAMLVHVKKTLKQQDSVVFYLMESFEVLDSAVA